MFLDVNLIIYVTDVTAKFSAAYVYFSLKIVQQLVQCLPLKYCLLSASNLHNLGYSQDQNHSIQVVYSFIKSLVDWFIHQFLACPGPYISSSLSVLLKASLHLSCLQLQWVRNDA